ncbi:hypothetical protein DFJ63DRAFT_334537 [Scheffersomyces coipomensis]|uniref:uncharacterized protein n=1 Tax=Scheffersomyces coipomensis TaxID=1788519 RepID=UPI00315DFBAE
MSDLLEIERSIFEEVNVIEDAIAQRFKRNPTLFPNGKYAKLKKSHNERLIQQHELKVFKERYVKRSKLLLHHKILQTTEIKNGLNSIKDSDFQFNKFDELLNNIKTKYSNELQVQSESIKDQYAMYSSVSSGDKTAKKSNILSAAASGLNISSLFTEEEAYGKFLGLQSHFEEYKSCIVKDDLSYVEYINLIDTFPSQQIRNMDKYKHYLVSLLEYLNTFIEKTHPLSDITLLVAHELNPSNNIDAEVNELYCVACHKLFTKATVFDAHLSGKKHIKNAKNSGSDISDLESKVKSLMTYLSKWKDATIANVERRLTMTDREKELEKSNIDEYENKSGSSTDDEDEDEDDDDGAFKNLPLDAYGKPIPFWLYKLQGLHKTYICEICGNITYKGKSVFVKHFSAPKHQYGLKCMGIEDEYMSLFKSIISIEEAQNLWKNIRKNKREQEGDIENAIEVEDDEGNVMSEKDYLDLKKQGLL